MNKYSIINPINGSQPLGMPQYYSLFKDCIQPSDRKIVLGLRRHESAIVTLNPLSSNSGYKVEVTNVG